MAITEKDKLAIDRAVSDLHWVYTDENGVRSFNPFYTDYKDTNDFLIQEAYNMRRAAFQEQQTYEPENTLIFTLQDMISDAYREQTWDIEDDIVRKAGFDPADDKAQEQLSYLRETYVMEFPFDHYLNQDVLVNIMLAGSNEIDMDFGTIKQQQEALCGKLEPEDTQELLHMRNGLAFLLEQQGHSMQEIQSLLPKYIETFYGDDADHSARYSDRYEQFTKENNRFLSSVCKELDELHNYMNCVTILSKMSLYQFAEMMQADKEVTFPKNSTVGFFCPWAGGGSVLEIELEKDLVVPSEFIWDAQIEGAQLDNQYSVNSVFGLVGDAWERVKSVADAHQTRKPLLDDMIRNASQKTQIQIDSKVSEKEAERS